MADVPPTIPFDASLEFIVAITIKASNNDTRWWQFMQSHEIPVWDSDSAPLNRESVELQKYLTSGYMRLHQQQYKLPHIMPVDIIKMILRYVVVQSAILPVPSQSAKPTWLPLWTLSRWESVIWATHPRNEFNFFAGLNDGDNLTDNPQLSTYPKRGRFGFKNDIFHAGEAWGHTIPLEGVVILDNDADERDVNMVTID